MIAVLAAFSGSTFWGIALALGLGAAVIVSILLTLLLAAVEDIDASVAGLLEVAGKLSANTEQIPQLASTAPVLGQIAEEAVVHDRHMSTLTKGAGGV